MSDAPLAGSNPSSPFPNSNDDAGPVYYDVSPKIILGLKITTGITVLMVLLAFIFCLVQGSGNHTFYLLACNLIVSSFVGLVNAYWYRRGDLSEDKYWFVALVAFVIIFQCFTTDIFVFHAGVPSTNSPTVKPPTNDST